MSSRGRRHAGGPDTRAAIVSATRATLAEAGTSRATVRAIAAQAEVDPALIYHYFATKDALVEAALTPPVDLAALLAGLGDDPTDAGAELVRRALDRLGSDAALRETTIGLLRTALTHEDAAASLRAALTRTILAGLRDVVASDRPELRAALVGSQLVGLLLARYVIAIAPLADASREDLVRAIGPTIQRYLTGPLG